mmetsp:Transcript_50037/g.128792  ORF Transcript_50037/g.128792 Transcript_50037/m.128792 type:complete len:101 (-) Transcript_50037:119-421(-)
MAVSCYGCPTKIQRQRTSSAHGTPFKRVDDTKTEVHEELQDVSYWSKRGDDFGRKAHEDLIKTRGKSFRHEKTKKKRGSYRGGAIDLGVNSFKFSHSDEE